MMNADPDPVDPLMKNTDCSPMMDEDGNAIPRSKYLSTYPLQSECDERPNHEGTPTPTLSGASIIKTMNLVFGHSGWGSEVTRERLLVSFRSETS